MEFAVKIRPEITPTPVSVCCAVGPDERGFLNGLREKSRSSLAAAIAAGAQKEGGEKLALKLAGSFERKEKKI